jgi:hypothetical protein
LLKLLLLLLLLFLREVMSDDATGRRAYHRMMPGHVTGYGTHRRTFDAALRRCSLRARREDKREQRHCNGL